MHKGDKFAKKTISVRVRPINASDFDFTRELASRSLGYTVPAPYVLWMLSALRRDFCVVADTRSYGNLGYLLVLPVGVHSKTEFVWQLACTFRDLCAGGAGVALTDLNQKIYAKTMSDDFNLTTFLGPRKIDRCEKL